MNTFDKIFKNTLSFLEGFTFEQLENSICTVEHTFKVEYIEPIKTYTASCNIIDKANINIEL